MSLDMSGREDLDLPYSLLIRSAGESRWRDLRRFKNAGAAIASAKRWPRRHPTAYAVLVVHLPTFRVLWKHVLPDGIPEEPVAGTTIRIAPAGEEFHLDMLAETLAANMRRLFAPPAPRAPSCEPAPGSSLRPAGEVQAAHDDLWALCSRTVEQFPPMGPLQWAQVAGAFAALSWALSHDDDAANAFSEWWAQLRRDMDAAGLHAVEAKEYLRMKARGEL